jgi:hypothetical protein
LRKAKIVAALLVALGVGMIVIGTIMPYYKTQQRLEGSGPGVEFTSTRPYWIRAYVIPPIDEGQPVTLSLISDKAGSTVVLLGPYDPDSGSITPPALVNVGFASDQKGIAVMTHAMKSSAYMLLITSYNSTYKFTFTSVWSPFYELRSLTTFGMGIVPFGLIMAYYDRIVEKREKMIEDALKPIRERQRREGR